MITSEKIDLISKALLSAQKQIGFAAKTSDNPFFKSKYADLATVIEAIKPSLNANGISFLQTVGQTVLLENSQPCISVTTVLLHESGQYIECTGTTPILKHDPQAMGSAVSYTRRYALAAITGLYQDDDDANSASGHQTKPQSNAAEKPSTKPSTAVAAVATAQMGLSETEKALAADLAKEIQNNFTDGLEELGFTTYRELESNELKIAVWALLPSNVRSSIKKIHSTEGIK